jgi:hypothetical protein
MVIGLVISGFMFRNSYDYEDNILATGCLMMLWPLLVGGFVFYLVAIGPYRLGEYIGNKIDEIKSR